MLEHLVGLIRKLMEEMKSPPPRSITYLAA